MAIVVEVTRQRRDKSYYKATTNPKYSYATTPSESGEVDRVEKGRLSGLTSRSISINFTAFSSLPIVTHLAVYRYEEIIAGNWQQQRVLFKYASAAPLTTSNLSFEIDIGESLTGVIIEYVIQ